tara:strand:+ start:60 stop:446 length:387 start_codon:yes stop_codon:yes gene_type:complete
MTNDIYEVMEYGPIVFSDKDYGVLITVNGAYFNWWNRVYDSSSVSKYTAGHGEMMWKCADVLYCDFGEIDEKTGLPHSRANGLYSMDSTTQLLTIMDRAKAWFEREVYKDEHWDEDHDLAEVLEEGSV